MPREHNTTDNGIDCWCKPRTVVPCIECVDVDVESAEGCWRCQGEKVVDVDPYLYGGPFQIIVIHNKHRG